MQFFGAKGHKFLYCPGTKAQQDKDGTARHGNNFVLACPVPWKLELVSKELNHFRVIADLFWQIGGHSSRLVLFCFSL